MGGLSISELKTESLKQAVSQMLGATIIDIDFQATQLHGGTVGEVQLVTGQAITSDSGKFPYQIVWKTQKKWERYGDPDSWRREYDLYRSDLSTLFTESFRWPVCYRAERNEDENETQLWMEYIDGVSGLALNGDQYERAAEELGRFQGRIYAEQPAFLKNLSNLSNVEYMKSFYFHYRSWKRVYDYIRSDDCGIPKHLCQMLIEIDEHADDIFNEVNKLPIVLCHRDFWVANLIAADENIILIDWDTAGWGYLGEDLASLIADEADVEHMVETYHSCVPAYYKGFSEYADLSHITDNCVYEMILLKFGYRLVKGYMQTESTGQNDEQMQLVHTLQKIYEMKAK